MASLSINHPTDRPNYSEVRIGNLRVAFSYSTPVAFSEAFSPWVVSENLWGPTTGKHLNNYADKSERIARGDFEVALDAAMDRVVR